MAASRPEAPGPPLSEQSQASAVLPDTIILHVLSPSPEVNGGKVTFPSIPLDTKISHLKSRIQNSMIAPVPPERQRLIYRGKPLLNMDATLRQVLQSELNASTEQNPSYTIHLIISPAPGSAPAIPTNTSQHYASQQGSMSSPGTAAHPPAASHQHHQHQPHVQLPVNPAMAHAQAVQAMFQNQLQQLQQQIAMTGMVGQGHGHGQGQGHSQGQGQGQGQRQEQGQEQGQVDGHERGHVSSQQFQMPPFSPPPPNLQAFQAAIMQQQQTRAHAGMHGIHNPATNGMPSGMPSGQNAQGPLGPVITRVHETVGPDGQRTRVVVNETTFQVSRQATPVPAADHGGGSHAPGHPSQVSNNAGLQLPPIAPQQHRNEPSSLPHWPLHANGRQTPPFNASNFVPQPPAYEPTVPSSRQETASTTTSAWLLSSPNGPQALVFAPGHGLFTNFLPSSPPSTRVHRPRTGLRFQQTPTGHIAPQNAANVPPPALNPNVANAQPQQALDAVVRAREAAVAARQANADANDFLRTVLGRLWTFIKLYFVIFMFTEPGSWFRWICLLVAVLVSAIPSTAVFRGLAARLQAQIDGLVPPPPQLAGVPVRQQVEGQGADGGALANGADASTGPGRQGEPDPAATAAQLVQEHRHRHPNMLRDTLERVERALGLFVASLIPGVGERHVRVREEARRERERVEMERIADEEARRLEKGMGKEKEKEKEGDEEVAEETGESSSKAAPQQEKTAEVVEGAEIEQKDSRAEARVEEGPLIEV